METSSYDELSFLHFNDVYHITQATALGRLSHVFRQAKRHGVSKAECPITVFSEDAFSPSLEGAVMKDFDIGEDVLVNLSKGCAFPWLLANAVHADRRLMATAQEYLVLEKNVYRIGFFGLAGTDWPSNCRHFPVDRTILEPVSVAQRISRSLRSTLGVDLIIRITHMPHEEDMNLARSCDKDINLILGGHDHDPAAYGVNVRAMDDTSEGNIKLIKSGTDFKNFSEIKMRLARKGGRVLVGRITVNQIRNTVTSSDDLPENGGIHRILSQLQTRMADTVDQPLFHSAVPLDGRTSVVRTEETNLGNVLADAVRAFCNTDVAFIKPGSLRCDRVIEAGVTTVKDTIDILPFDNPFVVERLRGRTIAAALDNSACDIVDGRFLQVSGLMFYIDPQAPIGSRVHAVHLAPGHTCGAPAAPTPRVRLDGEKEYTVSMVAFIAEGFDGYTFFRDISPLVDEEGAMTDSLLLLQVFRRRTHVVYGRESDVSVGRARAAIVLGSTASGLPFVSPSVQGRIMYILRCAS